MTEPYDPDLAATPDWLHSMLARAEERHAAVSPCDYTEPAPSEPPPLSTPKLGTVFPTRQELGNLIKEIVVDAAGPDSSVSQPLAEQLAQYLDAIYAPPPASELSSPLTIATPDDYEMALSEIEELIDLDPPAESFFGLELIRLTSLVQEYERQQKMFPASAPPASKETPAELTEALNGLVAATRNYESVEGEPAELEASWKKVEAARAAVVALFDRQREEINRLIERSVGAMAIAEREEGWQKIPLDCPMLIAVASLSSQLERLTKAAASPETFRYAAENRLARINELESQLERLKVERALTPSGGTDPDMDAEFWATVARDGQGFVRTQEEWDTLATYAREMAAKVEELSK